MAPSWEQVGWNSVREHEHDLLQASSLVLVTSSRGQEMIVMVAKPSVATVPINTDHPARVFGEKRYLEKKSDSDLHPVDRF